MRKIKLMALLLAALMVVTAFAGCAGVKQEDLDAVNDRVDALEDAINGVGDKIDALPGNNNQEILDAIESVKNDLNEKIESANDRIDEIKENPAVGTTDNEALKAAQTDALAKIKVQEVTFTENKGDYDDATYAAITAALVKAQAEVTAATTAEAVTAAMNALNTTLKDYKSYAMLLDEYYDALLGNIATVSEEYVEEVLALIEEIDEAYEELTDEKFDEMFERLVYEGKTEARNEYINVYDSVKALCNIYTKTTTVENFTVEFKNEKGRADSLTFKSLAAYKTDAKNLVKAINNEFEDEKITYAWMLENDILNAEDAEDIKVWEDYTAFAEKAMIIGGEELVKLVTNADLLVNAADAINNLLDAKYDYDNLNNRNENGLTAFTELGTANIGLTFEKELKNGTLTTVWYEDVYAEIEEALEAWVEEYSLSEDDAILMIGEDDYEAYAYARRYVALIAEAYETFESEIVPAIEDLNKLSEGSTAAVKDYNDVLEAIKELYLLQEGNSKAEEDLDKVDFYLSQGYFFEFLEETDILNVSNLPIAEMKELDETKAEEADKARFDAFVEALGENEIDEIDDAFVYLFVFTADANAIAKAKKNVDKDITYLTEYNKTTSDYTEIFTFFAKDFAEANDAADAINDVIKVLVDLVEKKKISSNIDFVTLAGEYINATNEAVNLFTEEEPFVSVDKDMEVVPGDDVYVAVADAINYEELTGDVKVTVRGEEVLTIDYFNFKYPVFAELIKIADFEAAQKALDDRIVKLFADIAELETLVEKINYVRANAYEYVDENKNGKYDEDEEIVGEIDEYTVSANEKAAIDNAIKIYDTWVYNGGNRNLAMFSELVNDETDKVYGGVYGVKGLDDPAGVAKVLETLTTLEMNVKTLIANANKFINGLKVVDKVNAYNSVAVSADSNKLTDTNNASGYAITGYNKTGTDAVNGKHGDWTYVYINSDNDTLSIRTATFQNNATDNGKYADVIQFLLGQGKHAGVTKAAVIEYMVRVYDDFYGANNEYVASSENDYEEDDAVYYENKGYAGYKSFDDAKASYDKYELVAAKAACLVAVTGEDGNVVDSFKRQVIGATTIENINGAIEEYNSLVAAEKQIKVYTAEGEPTEFVTWVIYEFDCLDYEVEA